MIAIDKNVPIPAVRGAGRPVLYPFPNMTVGDSFFVPGKTPRQIGGAAKWGTKKGWRFTTRTVTENGVAGVRIWRTA